MNTVIHNFNNVSEYCTNRNIVAGDAALKVRFLNLAVAIDLQQTNQVRLSPGEYLHLSGRSFNGITSPEVMPLVLTWMEWGQLNGL